MYKDIKGILKKATAGSMVKNVLIKHSYMQYRLD